MTQVNSHSRALIEVDNIDIAQIPVDTSLISEERETEILNILNEAFREPLSKYLFEEE